jgi:hypothetical protein
MFNLNEDNKSIEDLINYIDNKIIELRKNNKLSDDNINKLNYFYDKVIIKWMEGYYLINIELNSEEEKIIMNDLLDLISYLNKI